MTTSADTKGTIGRYQLVDVAGRGAMGVVYRAKDPLLGRTVALKVITPSVSSDSAAFEEFRKRFLREARAVAQLSHPNIVTVYDLGVDDDGTLYMAQEFIEGESLAARLRRGATTLDETISIVAQVAEGLAYAHERGVVHRDVKPDNILVENGGRAVVTDFGIAHMHASDLTRTGEILGTPHYMSPEQVMGGTIDGRSDLFSVGVLLYRMLAGQLPFEGPSVTSICYQIVHATPKALPDAAPIPNSLRRVVTRLLQKDPAQRFADGHELARALDPPEARTRQGASPALPRAAGASAETRVLPAKAARPAPAGTVVMPAPVRPPARSPMREGLKWAVLVSAGLLLIAIGKQINDSSHAASTPAAAPPTAPAAPQPEIETAASIRARRAAAAQAPAVAPAPADTAAQAAASAPAPTSAVVYPERDEPAAPSGTSSVPAPALRGEGPARRPFAAGTEFARPEHRQHGSDPARSGAVSAPGGAAFESGHYDIAVVAPFPNGTFEMTVDGTVMVDHALVPGPRRGGRQFSGTRAAIDLPAGSHEVRVVIKGPQFDALLERTLEVPAGARDMLWITPRPRTNTITMAERAEGALEGLLSDQGDSIE